MLTEDDKVVGNSYIVAFDINHYVEMWPTTEMLDKSNRIVLSLQSEATVKEVNVEIIQSQINLHKEITTVCLHSSIN